MTEPPSWDVLETRAAAAGLQIMRRPMSLSIYTQAPLMISRLLDLSIGDFERVDADQIMRGLVDAALVQIRAVDRPR